jgi:predicted phosphodiesterase
VKLLALSDLHNEIRPMSGEVDGRRIDSDVDLVVLAGDIHEGVQAPKWARQTFPDKEIILVAGNHEFYGQYWNRNLSKLRETSAELGIHFLENDSIELLGFRFLGCSLWTDFALHGEEQRQERMRHALERMTDYRRIKLDRIVGENRDFREFRSVTLVPELTRQRHRESVEWLERELNQGDPSRTVVVTHHAPITGAIPAEYQEDLLSPSYASDLARLMGRSALWIYGHTHESVDLNIGGTRIVSNPRGYPDRSGDSINEYFNPALTLEI